MDGEGRGVDRLVANDYVALLVHQDEIRNAHLAEVLRQGVEPEVVCQDWISNRDVACYLRHKGEAISECKVRRLRSRGNTYTFIKTTIGEDPVCSSEMLFPIQSFLLQAVELRISADLQRAAVFRSTHCAMRSVIIAFIPQGARCECRLAVSVRGLSDGDWCHIESVYSLRGMIDAVYSKEHDLKDV